MAYQQIPINSKPYKNIDDILNTNGSSDALVDGYIDEAGFTNKRPGIDSTILSNFSINQSVDGLFWWTSKKWLIAVCGGNVIKITDKQGNFTNITGDQLLLNSRPTFVDYGDNLLVTNGTKIVYTEGNTASQVIGTNGLNYTCIRSHESALSNKPITGANWATYWTQAGSSGVAWSGPSEVIGSDGLNYTCILAHLSDTLSNKPITGTHWATYWVQTGSAGVAWTDATDYTTTGTQYKSIQTTYLADVDAPQNSTHIAFLDTYVIGNFPGTGDFGYSNVADFRTWDALDFAVTEGNPDNGVALLVNNGMIYVIGERSIEVFYNDGATPFARYGQSFIDQGTIAKYTAIFIKGMLYFLNQDRKFVRMNGMAPQVIDMPFDRVIQELGTVNDAFADFYQSDGKMFYVVTFPSENFTVAYDILSDSWYQWGYWNRNSGTYDRFYPNCYVYCPEWGIHVVGDRYTGKIYKFGKDYYQDLDNVIRLLKRTGHIDYNTYMIKRSNSMTLKLKSGQVDDGSVMIRWKNDGSNKWGNYHRVSLKDQGLTNFFAKMDRLGIFRSRQYEIVHTDNSKFVIAGMEEDIEVLRG